MKSIKYLVSFILVLLNGCLIGPRQQKGERCQVILFSLPTYSSLFAEKTHHSSPHPSVRIICTSYVRRIAIDDLSDSGKVVYLDKELGTCIYYAPPNLTPYDTSEINREDTVVFYDLGDSILCENENTFETTKSGKFPKHGFDSTDAYPVQKCLYTLDKSEIRCARLGEVFQPHRIDQHWIFLEGIGQIQYEYGHFNWPGQSKTIVNAKYVVYSSDTLTLNGKVVFN